MVDSGVLVVKELCIGRFGADSNDYLVKNISFRLNPGEVLGITGQSGSGKTLTAMALAGILPESLAVINGKVWFLGEPVLLEKNVQTFPAKGRDIMMLFQSPSRALDPWVKIGTHLTDAIQAARSGRGDTPKDAAVKALEKAGLTGDSFDRYPFELSGGQRQRCLMALALAVKPRILIADEPATGQDDIHKALVMECIRDLMENEGAAVILISHDLRELQGLAQYLAVIFNGRQIETGTTRDVIENPRHEHTRELVRAMKFMEGSG